MLIASSGASGVRSMMGVGVERKDSTWPLTLVISLSRSGTCGHACPIFLAVGPRCDRGFCSLLLPVVARQFLTFTCVPRRRINKCGDEGRPVPHHEDYFIGRALLRPSCGDLGIEKDGITQQPRRGRKKKKSREQSSWMFF